MKSIIETLYPMNRCLLGEGFDNSLEFINHLIPIEILKIKSGTVLNTWTVPDEWIVRNAWVKFNGEKIIDYKVQPLTLVVGSLPIHKIMNLMELKSHIHYSEEKPDITPYIFKYYDKDWGFCLPYNKLKDFVDGEYEVFIDTEYRPGEMKIGVHTIKGTSDREILLFAHLDHPFQANDNLSAVACLVDLAMRIKCEHTIKIIFCPQTIGSIAYGLTQDISKVDFVIAVDVCGNENPIMLQQSFDKSAKINKVAGLALHSFAAAHRKGPFRSSIGSDEYFFNDPKLNMPGIMLSTWPYPEYHTSDDTPDKIVYERIERTRDVILKIIDIYEKDFIPVRKTQGPIMRSKYDIQTVNPGVNLAFDYFFYSMDGVKTLVELCDGFDIDFEIAYKLMERMIQDGQISRVDIGKIRKSKTSRKKS